MIWGGYVDDMSVANDQIINPKVGGGDMWWMICG